MPSPGATRAQTSGATRSGIAFRELRFRTIRDWTRGRTRACAPKVIWRAMQLVDEIHPAGLVHDQHTSLRVRGHEARPAARGKHGAHRQSRAIDDDDATGVEETDDQVCLVRAQREAERRGAELQPSAAFA